MQKDWRQDGEGGKNRWRNQTEKKFRQKRIDVIQITFT